MKITVYLTTGLLVLLSWACREAPPEQARQVKQYTIEQFMNNTNMFGSSFSADEQHILVTSDASGIYNAYRIPFAGGEPDALTRSTGSSVYAVSYFPEDERILFQMDDNGNEIFHLFVQTPEGETIELTPDSAARANFLGWAYDEKSFYIGWTKRNPQLTDIYEVSLENLQPRLIYANDEAYGFGGISPDKRFMALTKPINTNDSQLFIYDFESKAMAEVSEAQAGHSPADFSPDSKYLYYLTDEGSEYNYLKRYDLTSGSREEVLEKDWDISYAYFSRNGKYRVVGINADGKTVIEVMNMETGQPVDFPDLGEVDITAVNIADSEDRMAFYAGSSSSPANLHVYDFTTKEHRQLTQNLNPEIDPGDLVTAEVVRYKSFDGLDIPAIYYRPVQASSAQPAPALVWVHGGPGGQSRQSYNALLQYLVNHGYAVLAVNNRGSSGYGKTFFRMDDQRHGEEDLKDCIWGKKWLGSQAYIDSTSIGILGGSYGGFMVMRAMTHTPEAFAVGVDIFGVTNWVRTIRSIPPWWESFKVALYEEMGDPYSADSVRLKEISPVFQGEKVKNPVMVLQGAQDPRVLKIESDEMVEAIRTNNVPIEYVVFDDEGHGFAKKKNQQEAYSKILDFLNKYLRQEPGIKG